MLVKISKEEVAYRINFIKDNYLQKKVKRPVVSDFDETVNCIIEQHKSVSRFGDGEFNLISGQSLPFQEFNPKLSEKLKMILKTNQESILICLPDVFSDLTQYVDYSKKVWTALLAKNRREWNTHLNLDKIYYNAFLSRPYIIYKDKSSCNKKFNKLKQIWHKRDILIVEGNQSRLGVGNDLFDNSKSIERIICPSINAFSAYDEIYNAILSGNPDKDKLVLLALGPTATVLAYDLCLEGIQAIDIGHIDIEYEWFLNQAEGKVKIKGKYTNEAINGDQVEIIFDESYNSQIIKTIL